MAGIKTDIFVGISFSLQTFRQEQLARDAAHRRQQSGIADSVGDQLSDNHISARRVANAVICETDHFSRSFPEFCSTPAFFLPQIKKIAFFC